MIIILLFITIIIANVFVVFKFFSRIAAIDTKKWANSVAIYQIVEIVPKSLSLLIIPLSVYYSEEIIMKNKEVYSALLSYSVLCEFLGLLIGLLLIPNFLFSINKMILEEKRKIGIPNFIKFYFDIILLKNRIKSHFLFFKNIENKNLFKINIFTGFFFSLTVPLLVLLSINFVNHRGTLISIIPFIIGLTYVIFSYFVERPLGYFTDLAYENKMEVEKFENILVDCIFGKLIGALLAFFAIIPILKILVKFSQ